MNNDLYFDGKRFISSSRAAKISGYVNDYIGQLCRDGKLDCRMVGRTWYVSFESLIFHKNTNANGTRSKGSKKGPGALNLAPKTSPKVFPISLKNLDEEFKSVSNQAPEEPVTGVVSQVSHAVPGALNDRDLSTTVSAQKNKRSFDFSAPKLVFGAVTIFMALLGFRWALTVNPFSQQIYSDAWQSTQSELSANVFSGAKEIFNRASIFVYETVHNLIFHSNQKVFVVNNNQTTNASDSSSSNAQSGPNQGMVVVPINEKTNKDAVVAKVKSSFSDEVTVNPTDSESGVITPVFKESKGDDYLYVLVPIKN